MLVRMVRLFALLSSITLVSYGQAPLAAVEIGWLPVTEAEKALKEPSVEKTAGVEAIFWREHVWDELLSQDWQRKRVVYVRLKIFNEEGKKAASSIDIPYRNNIFIENIEGRTIKPDGTIVLLEKKDIHERDVLKASGLRLKAKNFSMPAVEPGVIVEYKFRETQFKQDIFHMRAQMQQEYPIQRITYFVKPLPRDLISYGMRVWPFHCQPSKLKLENNGFNSTFLENVPAFKEEPFMPGEPNVRPWIMFVYMEDGKREPQKYWEKVGKDSYTRMKIALKVNDEIKAAANKAIEGAKDDQGKVVALIIYLRKNMRGLFDASVTEAERTKAIKALRKEGDRTSTEVFKSGIGTNDELNTLFAAMAQAVGLEARPVFLGSREDIIFDPVMTDGYFLNNVDMAVKLGGEWKMFDVSTRYLPPDMISWTEEGIRALLSDPKAPQFIGTPLSPPEASVSHRVAKLALLDDGTLEGDVTIIYTGHAAGDRRRGYEGLSPEKRTESLKEAMMRMYPSAELSELKVDNVEDTTQGLTHKYRIKIPNYAERTGRRLLFTPFYFQQGSTPRFSASQRKFDIHFRYAFTEDDTVRIQLPDGYELDNPENPGSLQFGGPGKYDVKMSRTDKNELLLSRQLIFGVGGAIVFPAEIYPRLKQVFDEIHKRDGTIISLRQSGNR